MLEHMHSRVYASKVEVGSAEHFKLVNWVSW